MTPTIYVHTLGDSTLDNYWWLINEDSSNRTYADANCVEGRLEAQLNQAGQRYKVVSHAYDGFTTSSVLRGDRIGSVLPDYPCPTTKAAYKERKQDASSPGRLVYPLRDLAESIAEHPSDTHYVVISVGGNDFRENLLNPIKLLWDIPSIRARYLKIVDEVKQLNNGNVRPILMFQYRTDAINDSYSIYTVSKVIGLFLSSVNILSGLGIALSPAAYFAGKISMRSGSIFTVLGAVFLLASSKVIPLKVTKGILSGQSVAMATLGGLMERFYSPILAKAKQDKIPIVDLPNIFNPYHRLYISGIEPNTEGGGLIAVGITHIVYSPDFGGESLLYSYDAELARWVKKGNPGSSGWEVQYPSSK